MTFSNLFGKVYLHFHSYPFVIFKISRWILDAIFTEASWISEGVISNCTQILGMYLFITEIFIENFVVFTHPIIFFCLDPKSTLGFKNSSGNNSTLHLWHTNYYVLKKWKVIRLSSPFRTYAAIANSQIKPYPNVCCRNL